MKHLFKSIVTIYALFFLTLLFTQSAGSLAQATLTPEEQTLFRAIENNNETEIMRFRKLLPNDLKQTLGEIDRPQLPALLSIRAPHISTVHQTLESLTPLHSAALLGHDDFIETTLQSGVDVDTLTKTGYTPLFFAVAGRNESTFHLLLEKSATQHQKFPAYSELIDAINRSNLEYIKEFKASGKSFDFVFYDGTTPLGKALSQGRGREKNSFDLIELMISLGANVMIQDSKGRTPLHYAAYSDLDHDIAKLLIKHADNKAEYVNVQEETGLTPLHISFFGFECKNAQLLIKNGAKNLKTMHQVTAIDLAFNSGKEIYKIRQCLDPLFEEFEASSEVVEFRWNSN